MIEWKWQNYYSLENLPPPFLIPVTVWAIQYLFYVIQHTFIAKLIHLLLERRARQSAM